MTNAFARTSAAALVFSLTFLTAAEARTGAEAAAGGNDNDSAAELAAARQHTHAWPFPVPWMSDDMYFKACKKAGGGASLDEGGRHCSDADGHPVLVPFPIPID